MQGRLEAAEERASELKAEVETKEQLIYALEVEAQSLRDLQSDNKAKTARNHEHEEDTRATAMQIRELVAAKTSLNDEIAHLQEKLESTRDRYLLDIIAIILISVILLVTCFTYSKH